MKVLGFSIGVRGSAAALVSDGRTVAAAREEWFSRVPFDAGFPERAMTFCLESADISIQDVDAIVRAGRAEGRLATLSSWFGALAETSTEGRSLFGRLRKTTGAGVQTIADAQAAVCGVFYPSPFDKAAILVLNGPGQGIGSVLAVGEGSAIRILTETPSPHGPGALYATLASELGRRFPQDEAELMDLARLGRPRYAANLRRDWVELLDSGACRILSLDKRPAGGEFFGRAGEDRRTVYEKDDMDMARSVQVVYEDVLLHAARRLRKQTGLKRLVLGGDAALNGAALGRLLQEGVFDEVWTPPTPIDGASGAALDVAMRAPDARRELERMNGYVGPAFAVPAIESYLIESKVASEKLPPDQLVLRVTAALAAGHTVGWFQGSMCAGPQGLGARAILADPRSGSLRDFLNMRVKRRGPFRTFSASVTAEDAGSLFELRGWTPYGYVAAPLRRSGKGTQRSRKTSRGTPAHDPARLALPGVVQADGMVSLRVVEERSEPLLHALLKGFATRTGCPLLLTDSLSLESEPAAASPRDAYAFFMRSDLEHLVLGPFLIDKRQQPLWEDRM